MFARRKCRLKGHVIDPDPGDFILACTRCGRVVDMFDLIAAADRAAIEGAPK